MRIKYKPLLNWLRTNVHTQGSKLRYGDLIQQATGNPLDLAAYKAGLEAQYIGPTPPTKTDRPSANRYQRITLPRP